MIEGLHYARLDFMRHYYDLVFLFLSFLPVLVVLNLQEIDGP